MNDTREHAGELEKLRQERLCELTAENGPGWQEQYKPGSFGCHELLDRTAQAATCVEQFVLDHPACISNPDWFALAERAVDALNELYQRVGSEHMTESGSNETAHS